MQLFLNKGNVLPDDSPCSGGRSVPVTDLSNGLTQYCVVPLLCCCGNRWTENQHASEKVLQRVKESLTFLSLWLTASETHTHTHTLIMTGNTVKKPVDFHVFVDFFPPRPPTSFFSVNLRILHFSLKKKKSSPHTPPGITFKFLLLQFNFGLKPCVTSPKVQTDSLKPPTSKLDSLL